MATKTKAQLEQEVLDLRAQIAGLLDAVNKLGDVGKPRRVLVTDVTGNQTLIDADRVMQIVPSMTPVKNAQLPNTFIPSSVLVFNYANDGKLGTAILPGKPEGVATLLGLAFSTVELPAPTPRVIVSSTAEATAAIAAVQAAGSSPVNP